MSIKLEDIERESESFFETGEEEGFERNNVKDVDNTKSEGGTHISLPLINMREIISPQSESEVESQEGRSNSRSRSNSQSATSLSGSKSSSSITHNSGAVQEIGTHSSHDHDHDDDESSQGIFILYNKH